MTYTQLSNTEPYLIIHADGGITVSEKLQPSEIAARVLECMKTQWMEDSQSKQIRELQDRIKRLEEQLMDSKNKHAVLVADVVLNEDRAERIKRLEEAGDYLCAAAAFMGWHDKIETWNKAKESKP